MTDQYSHIETGTFVEMDYDGLTITGGYIGQIGNMRALFTPTFGLPLVFLKSANITRIEEYHG